jgi:Holliday junction resolvase
MRYGIMFAVKSPTQGRKVTVMDFKKERMITFTVDEIDGDEMEEDLKEFMKNHLEKLSTGYWDYSGKRKGD